MQRKLLSILAGGALLFSATASAFAQGESGGATSGGATSGGAASEAPAPEAAPATPDNRPDAAALPPAPAAGAGAPFFSDAALIGIGAAAVLAGVLVAVTSSSSSTTTTTGK